MSKYLAFVNLLILIFSKRATLWPLVLQLIEMVKQIATEIRGAVDPATEPGVLEMSEASPEVLEAEGRLAQVLATEGAEAAFDFSRLRRLWKFIEASGLSDLLLDLLKGVLAGAPA